MATVSRSVLQLRKLRDAILEKVELPSGQKLKSAKIGVEYGAFSIDDAPFVRIWPLRNREKPNSNTRVMDLVIAIATDVQPAVDNSMEAAMEAAASIEEQVRDILRQTNGLAGEFNGATWDADDIAHDKFKVALKVVAIDCSILV